MNRTIFEALNATNAGPGLVALLVVVAQDLVWFLPALVAAVWLIGDRASRDTAVRAFLAACVAMTAAHIASILVVHPRPFAMGLAPNLLDHANDSSFPSDHTTLFFALAVAFGRSDSPHLRGLSWLLAGLGVSVGLARVALGVHFPLDILGAAAIGAGAALTTEIGLRRVSALLYAAGEWVRRLIGPLAAWDARERVS